MPSMSSEAGSEDSSVSRVGLCFVHTLWWFDGVGVSVRLLLLVDGKHIQLVEKHEAGYRLSSVYALLRL